jgi:hypothetical protein
MAAANPLQGELKFATEDGREFTAVFDIPAICALEDLLDRPAVQIAAQIVQGRVGFVRAGLLTGLRRHHPDLTPGDVDRIMTTLAGDKLPSQIVLDGLNLAFPKPKKKLGEGDAPDPQTAPGEAGTGKPS